MSMAPPPGSYATLGATLASAAGTLRLPQPLTAPEAAEKHMVIQKQVASGPFSFFPSPYARRILDAVNSWLHRGVTFVGPAQAGDRDALRLPDLACHLPADGLPGGREVHAVDARPVNRPRRQVLPGELRARVMLMPGKAARSMFMKLFRNGMPLKVSRPSVNEMAGHSKGAV